MSTKIVKTLKFPNDSNDYQINAAYLNGLTAEQILATNDALLFKGALSGALSSPGTFTPAADAGHVYKVSTSGWINGEKYEVGETLICSVDSTAAATSSNYNTIKNNWIKLQNNIDLATEDVQGTLKLGNSDSKTPVEYRPVELDSNYQAYTTESKLSAGVGLKVETDSTNDTRKISIDEEVTFLFVCGTAADDIELISYETNDAGGQTAYVL